MDAEDLLYAKRLLEYPGFAARLVNTLGRPIEKTVDLLPKNWAVLVHDVTRKALERALDYAIRSLERSPNISLNRISVMASGGIAGALGLPALAVELPFSTVMIFRSIADIAESEGEDMQTPAARLAMLEVFALGGGSRRQSATETGYYAVRTSLATLVSDASRYITGRRVTREGAPVVIRLLEAIAERFGAAISEKALAAAVPVVGAAGGALINVVFFNHFQSMARGHFIVRRLERKYGEQFIRTEYAKIT